MLHPGFNIRFLGVPENDEENCVTQVENLLHDHFNTDRSIIENAHRVGTTNRRKPIFSIIIETEKGNQQNARNVF